MGELRRQLVHRFEPNRETAPAQRHHPLKPRGKRHLHDVADTTIPVVFDGQITVFMNISRTFNMGRSTILNSNGSTMLAA